MEQVSVLQRVLHYLQLSVAQICSPSSYNCKATAEVVLPKTTYSQYKPLIQFDNYPTSCRTLRLHPEAWWLIIKIVVTVQEVLSKESHQSRLSLILWKKSSTTMKNNYSDRRHFLSLRESLMWACTRAMNVQVFSRRFKQTWLWNSSVTFRS